MKAAVWFTRRRQSSQEPLKLKNLSLIHIFTGLVGKNGSGKTTLIRSVLGVIPKTAGTVQVLGGDITADPAIREQVGFVSETPYYIPTLTTEMVLSLIHI